ncbi:superoxide dismutase [Kibdelosporangium philippinense]|uniref:Superoxide dismutase n=1 Tax=Kibdelosporangium philippinense TaxID=211113 RepID=A0ABS8ZT79_9PSEU|nr:superoxide dismutase [Kibdelosporangium philippinense]MCE7010906.1 superoxide dismutase [Kibdelosporangium philippinense]
MKPQIGAALLIAVSACSTGGVTPPPNTRSQEAAVRQDGTLAPPESATNAFSYSPAAPVGAELTAEILVTGDATNVQLTATGLLPNREYAVRAHTKPCGKSADDAGPRFQNRVDPRQPSVDPAYANPDNEIWLDLRTDHDGAAKPRTSVPFTLSERAPASFVVSESDTRLACFTLRAR